MSKTSQLRHKAQVLLKKGKLNEAIEEYKRLLNVESKNPNLYNELGDIFLRSGDRIQAVSCFEKAAANYEHVALYNNAIAVCKKILRVIPNRLDTIYKLGEIRAKQKFDGEAVNYFSQFLNCLISEPQAMPDNAQERIERILELLPDNGDIVSNAANVFGQIGMTMRAAELIGKLLMGIDYGCEPEKYKLYKNRLDMFKSKLSPDELQDIENRFPIADIPKGETIVRATGDDAIEDSEMISAWDASADVPSSVVPPTAEGPEAASGALGSAAGQPEGPAESVAPGTAPEATPAEAESVEAPAAAAEPEIDTDAGQRPSGAMVDEARPVTEEVVPSAMDPAAGSETPDAMVDEARPAVQTQEAAADAPLPTAEQIHSMGAESSAAESATAPTEPCTDAAPSAAAPDRQERSDADRRIADEIKHDVEEDDYRSHYDLGMAYVEMALYSEAVKELQIAARSDQLRLKSYEMIGHCFILQNNPRLAVKQLNRGLDMVTGSGEDALGIHYNLGTAYEMLGDMEKAREHFEEVYIVDVTFRDVDEKMKKFSPIS